MNPTTPVASFDQTLENTRQTLLDSRHPAGFWEGELSSSALSTATAVCALRMVRDAQAKQPQAERQAGAHDADQALTLAELDRLIHRGLAWLAKHQNADGGWGDTTQSYSNISTTLLGWAAFSAATSEYPEVERAVRAAIVKLTAGARDTSKPKRSSAASSASVGASRGQRQQENRTETAQGARTEAREEIANCLDPATLARAIRARYGRDQTFSVPILTTLALMGRLGSPTDAWKHVPQLPFELAACPRSWFAALKLPVVSYALPALIAIGLVRHRRRPTWNIFLRGLRYLATRRTLTVLKSIQPTTGGYLEATPLTSFVVLSLVGAGEGNHPVVAHGVDFLRRSVREDGSWPIDTHLATWVTTLAMNALGHSHSLPRDLGEDGLRQVRKWLLDQQYKTKHPYTEAAPGGWSWTPLSGGVPDADDTPGALLALHALCRATNDDSDQIRQAAIAGVNWLIGLQNADGGMPTFCRGWGTLPFDRSSPDITAHAVRAWLTWYDLLPDAMQRRLHKSVQRAIAYLLRVQQPSGAWAPLWFGNQDAADESNLTYGTSRVLLAMLSFQAQREQQAMGRQAHASHPAGADAHAVQVHAGHDRTAPAQLDNDPTSRGEGRSEPLKHRRLPGAHTTREHVEPLQRARMQDAPLQDVPLQRERMQADWTSRSEAAPQRARSGELERQPGPVTVFVSIAPRIDAALDWLLAAQNEDGGWGGGLGIRSSVEETALALEALADVVARDGEGRADGGWLRDRVPACLVALRRGTEWLSQATSQGRSFPTSPIGFYFAKLWYFERLYPLVYSLAALNRTARIREQLFVQPPLVSSPLS